MGVSKKAERIQAVIFDLDGVLVSTDEQHYQSWKRLADEEGIHFDREINRECLGLSRMDSLEVVLRNATRAYSESEKAELAERKNRYFHELVAQLSPNDLKPGAAQLLRDLKGRAVKLAVASGSRNAPAILSRLGLAQVFDVCISGSDIARSKPDPEVFLRTAERLGVPSQRCLVVEDAPAGVEAARRAGMQVVAVGPRPLPGVARTVRSLADIAADELLSV